MIKAGHVTVIGAGAGGTAAAAVLVKEGVEVTLFSRTPDRLLPLRHRGGIEITGDRGEGFVPLHHLTTDIAEAARARCLLVFTVANAHADIARLLAPHLTPEHVVLIASGSGGTLELARLWREVGVQRLPLLGETATLPQSARIVEPARLKIRFPWTLRTAAFPAVNTDALLDALRPYGALLRTLRGQHVLDPALNNPNFIIHPAPMVLNYAAIERADGLLSLMNEGMTEAVLRTMDAHDSERMALLEAVGVRPISLDDLYYEFGSSPAIYRSSGEPMGLRDRIHFRYIDEDVPYGSVFMSSLGRLLGVHTPINDALNTLASIARGVDYWGQGRTVERLGLAGLRPDDLRHYLQTGER